MKEYLVLENLDNFNIPQKIEFYRYIIIQLKKSNIFINPTIKLSRLSANIDSLELIYTHLTLSPYNNILKELLSQKEKSVDYLFTMQASYINRIAAENKKIIIESGFFIQTQHPQ